MPDYKELYLKLFRASADAIDLLVAAQQACEELVIAAPEGKIVEMPDREDRPDTLQ